MPPKAQAEISSGKTMEYEKVVFLLASIYKKNGTAAFDQKLMCEMSKAHGHNWTPSALEHQTRDARVRAKQIANAYGNGGVGGDAGASASASVESASQGSARKRKVGGGSGGGRTKKGEKHGVDPDATEDEDDNTKSSAKRPKARKEYKSPAKVSVSSVKTKEGEQQNEMVENEEEFAA